MTLNYQESPYSSRAMMVDCRNIQACNVPLNHFKDIVRQLYALPLVFDYNHNTKCVTVSFEQIPRSEWNEYTVQDGRTIGYITEVNK